MARRDSPEASREYFREYARRNREKVNARQREIYAGKSAEEKKLRSRTQWERHSEKRKAKFRAQYAANPAKFSEKQKKAMAIPANREKQSRRVKDWTAKNKLKMRAAYRRSYRKQAADPALHMGLRLRSRLGSALRKIKASKCAHTQELTGCSLVELKRHIEFKFKPGMSWSNRNLWHVDHILPVASFDLLDPDQQRKCFHYTNLQPLWWSENLAKGDKIIPFLETRAA